MKISWLVIFFLGLNACNTNTYETKGFQVSSMGSDEKGEKIVGVPIDSLNIESRPRNVLMTGHSNFRLVPIFKVNYNKKGEDPFIGDLYYHNKWGMEVGDSNNWHHNFMPGYTAVYGYNLINTGVFKLDSNRVRSLFEQPVLIKTLYFPAFSNDTLNSKPINRNYYMVSVYDEDSNKDGFINVKDLRRFYLFDLEGNRVKALVPNNYSVRSCTYDRENDYMYVYAVKDSNGNGQIDAKENHEVFWVDLEFPSQSGLVF